MIVSRGKRHAAPVAASLKSGSRVNGERWADETRASMILMHHTEQRPGPGRSGMR